jgi:hypothetical protein
MGAPTKAAYDLSVSEWQKAVLFQALAMPRRSEEHAIEETAP